MDRELILVEIAPGVDLQKHIIEKMGFIPKVSKDLKVMDRALYMDEPMNLWKKE